MATVPTGTRDPEFGCITLSPAQVAICRALRPLPSTLVALQGAAWFEIATVSEALLLEAACSGRADCLYVFCRVNANRVRRMVDDHVLSSALPFQSDPLITEVFAQVTDANRSGIPAHVRRLNQSIPEICERVVGETADEVLGFVPTIGGYSGSTRLGQTIAERLDLPHRVTKDLERVVDLATTNVLAAQSLLGLSFHDRSLLLALEPLTSGSGGGALSVAQLLSMESADRRFHDEFNRIVRWLRRAIESDAAMSRTGEEKLR